MIAGKVAAELTSLSQLELEMANSFACTLLLAECKAQS